jgi:hypothetical protein
MYSGRKLFLTVYSRQKLFLTLYSGHILLFCFLECTHGGSCYFGTEAVSSSVFLEEVVSYNLNSSGGCF